MHLQSGVLGIFIEDLLRFYDTYLFGFVKHGTLIKYADDNSVSVNNKELNIVYRLLESVAEATAPLCCSDAIETNPTKFQGILSKGNKWADDVKVSFGGQILNCQNQWPL